MLGIKLYGKAIIIICILIFSFFQEVTSQIGDQKDKINFSGYLSVLPYTVYDKISEDWNNNLLLHNRLNIFYYPTDQITTTIQLRNRFLYGDFLEVQQNYASLLERDDGYLDMSKNIFEKNSTYVFNMNIDRLWVQYTVGNLDIKLGRQRINWGQAMAWNPNDIFNTFNFFDFDYAEKPGSDALRLQYYTSMTSVLEFATKIDRNNKITSAGLYRFNVANYDFQAFGGILNEQDWVIGSGWSGSVKGAGFRGEISYFQPYRNKDESNKTLITSVSLDYMFANSLYVLIEGLYNKKDEDRTVFDFQDYFQETLNVKDISFSEFSLLGQVSYPFTPLLNASLSAMVFKDLSGFFLGPNIDYSLGDNLGATIYTQYFRIKTDINLPQIPENYTVLYLYLRLKYNF